MTLAAPARTLVIAEAGVNHNGSLDLALRLVDAAAEAGADIVKFQTFRADKLASRHSAKAAYQVRATGSDDGQLAMLRALELDEARHERIIAHCAARGIAFLSTPFDLDSLALLTRRFDVDRIKLGSGEVTNGPLLLAAARTQRPIILSTGMATLGEVEAALALIGFGLSGAKGDPTADALAAVAADRATQALLRANVTLLHCTTEYPAPYGDVNLRAMDTLKAAFGLPVGFSDHTVGITVAIAAAARGAVMIEKHFTLDRALPGPDHAASLEPGELAEMVCGIRIVEEALGDGIKAPRAVERANAAVARKSLVAATDIAAGAIFSEGNLAVKRPGSGISPMRYWEMLGRRAGGAYAADDVIEP